MSNSQLQTTNYIRGAHSAPPHHYVVPSPYKQGESAIRDFTPQGSFSLLLSDFSFPLHFHFRNHFPVKEAHDAVGIIGVVLGVGHHYDGCAFGVKLLEQVHYFCAVL